jgi:hypothetical protein
MRQLFARRWFSSDEEPLRKALHLHLRFNALLESAG